MMANDFWFFLSNQYNPCDVTIAHGLEQGFDWDNSWEAWTVFWVFLPHVWSQMMCEGNKAMAMHFAQTNVSRSRATNRWTKPATTAIHIYISHRWCLQHIYMNWSSTSNRGSLVSLRNGSYLGGVGYEAFCYQVH